MVAGVWALAPGEVRVLCSALVLCGVVDCEGVVGCGVTGPDCAGACLRPDAFLLPEPPLFL